MSKNYPPGVTGNEPEITGEQDHEKRTYVVKMPLAGYLEVVVYADNEDEALKQFDDVFDKSQGLLDPAHELYWEFINKIVEGNVLYAPLNEVEVTDETPDEEETEG